MKIHLWNYNNNATSRRWVLLDYRGQIPLLALFSSDAKGTVTYHSIPLYQDIQSKGFRVPRSLGSPMAMCPHDEPFPSLLPPEHREPWLAIGGALGPAKGGLGLCPAVPLKGPAGWFLHCLTPGHPKSEWMLIGPTFGTVRVGEPREGLDNQALESRGQNSPCSPSYFGARTSETGLQVLACLWTAAGQPGEGVEAGNEQPAVPSKQASKQARGMWNIGSALPAHLWHCRCWHADSQETGSV
jgi:hypothetical protein